MCYGICLQTHMLMIPVYRNIPIQAWRRPLGWTAGGGGGNPGPPPLFCYAAQSKPIPAFRAFRACRAFRASRMTTAPNLSRSYVCYQYCHFWPKHITLHLLYIYKRFYGSLEGVSGMSNLFIIIVVSSKLSRVPVNMPPEDCCLDIKDSSSAFSEVPVKH
jgi:hypothetical protein